MIAILVLNSSQDPARTRTLYILLSITLMWFKIEGHLLVAHLRLYNLCLVHVGMVVWQNSKNVTQINEY